ncbi:MAG: pilus assembly protein [Xanthobacteraceae bacterium]|nr:pilus assembly protein [Xanthobacteraceae bacterium]
MIRSTGKNFAARFARMRALAARFRSDRRGNVAVISALAALPMVTAVGCVIDYSNAAMIRTKLQAAADAASLATVSTNSTVLNTAQNMTTNGSVSGGSTFANYFFTANLPAAYSTLTPTSTVTKTGKVITATVAFSTTVSTYFMGIIGYKTITIAGTSTSSYTMPAYINFYLMLDVSGSMSFPSTTAEQQRLMAVNPDNLNGSNGYPSGCQFACHFTAQGACAQTSSQGNPWQGPIPAAGSSTNPGSGGYCQGFIISRLGTTPATFTSGTNPTNGNNVNWSNTPVTSCSTPGTTSCIQLRADAVGYAVNALLATAYASETAAGVTNQFKIGLYPFIVNLYSYFPLTTSINGSSTSSGTINYAAAQLATLLDTGVNTNLGSGGTHFENAFPSMNSLITTVGTGGSSTNALPYVFLITDGSQDCQTQSGGNWGGDAGCSPDYNSATTLNATTLCAPLKARGITIAVLYIPYGQIVDPNPNFANAEDTYANDNIPNIPASLQACASPDFFYTANTPADITSALLTMFEQAVSTAHVSN